MQQSDRPEESAASLGELRAIEKAVDDLHARIKKLESENNSLRFSNSELQDEKKKLTYLLADMEQRYISSKNEGRSEAETAAKEEAEAILARQLHALEVANSQLDAECDLIGSDRDALQNKLVDLEATCRQQSAEIETLRSNRPVNVAGLKTVVDSLKAKLGLEE